MSMDSTLALPAGLDTVDTTGIALTIVFLTVPGIALTHGLKRFRDPAGAPGGKVTAALQQPLIKLASFVSLLAMLAAGLGLVPLAHALYQLISGTSEWAPALIGVAVLALLLIKWVVVSRDLADGKVDRPYLWLAPVPLAAMLIWAAPTVYEQITDQAQGSVEMLLGKHPTGGRHAGQGHHGDSDNPPKNHNKDHDKNDTPSDKNSH
jgi:uncharacterized membrane protein